MKKDPLQRTPTPYETLGVEPGAADEAMARAVTEDAGEMTAAAEELRDPARRALVDLFLYQERYLDDLAYDDPIGGLGETAARRRADERWRAIEKRGFPMPAATHSMAVLSYWEARASGRNGPDLPTPPDVTGRLWDAALSRFAALGASEAFWTEWGVLTENRGVGEGAANALERRLVDELEEMAAVRKENADVPGESRVREQIALYRSELRAARALPALRILSGRGLSPAGIAAGPHLLAELGLYEKVRASVEAQHPDLLPLFSRYAAIALLVEEKEYGSAHGAIERLDADARDEPEVRDLETRVQLALGLGALSADRTDEALAHWERAIDRAEVRSQAAVPIAEAALSRAKLLHSRDQRDDGILLLQRTLPLGERTLLAVPLAHFLHERADGRIEAATAGSGEGVTDLGPAIAEMRGAVADLEEAVVLDPTNGAVRDRRNEAEDLLAALLARAGPEAVAEPVASEAEAAPAAEQAPTAVAQSPATQRGSAVMIIGVALWVGITLLALVVLPLLMPQRFGGLGTVIALGVAVGWIATNALGWFLIR